MTISAWAALAIVVGTLAAAGVWLRRGRRRAAWIGFALALAIGAGAAAVAVTASGQTVSGRGTAAAAPDVARGLPLPGAGIAHPGAVSGNVENFDGASRGSVVEGAYSGYYTGGNPHSVSASWTVPAVTCKPGQTSGTFMWVGLQGSDSTGAILPQNGASWGCRNGQPDYWAWTINIHGAYPPLNILPGPVRPGDQMSASTRWIGDDGKGNGHYVMVVIDTTQGWERDVPALNGVGSAISSADVVAENYWGGGPRSFGPVSVTNALVDGRPLASAADLQAEYHNPGNYDGDPTWVLKPSRIQPDGQSFSLFWTRRWWRLAPGTSG